MKKKFTMLFALLLCCVGAWAQTAITKDAFDAAKKYRVYNCATDKKDTQNMAWTVTTDGVICLTAYDSENAKQIWQFIEGEGDNAGKYLLYNVASATYMKGVYGANGVASTEDVNAAVYYIKETRDEDDKFAFHHEGAGANSDAARWLWNDGGGKLAGWTGGNEWFSLEEASEEIDYVAIAKEELKTLIDVAQEVYTGLANKEFTEAVALNAAISAAQNVYNAEDAELEAINEQITLLTAAKDAAEPYPFVESATKSIEAGKYFIYYTDENSVKHYLQTSGSNSIVTVTDDPVSYDIATGTVNDGKYTKAYTLKMNGLYISNTSSNATNIETKNFVGLWSSQVIFEKEGKAAIRLTNAKDVDNWHGNYFINKGAEGATIASDPSLGDALFFWTIEADLQSMRDEMAELKTSAETAKSTLKAKVVTAPLTEVISALAAAITYATENASSNDKETLNTGIAQLNAAMAKNVNLTFNSGSLASLEAGEYVIYYEDANSVKHYLVNNKNTKRAVTSTIASVYDVTLGNVNGYAAYAYYFDMNQSKISNPTDDDAKEIQVEPKGSGSTNYESNRVWDSQVLYVNAAGKYAIRSTNCNVGEGWKSDCFITVSENGATVSGQNTELTDALYKWNVVKASEANIAYTMNIDKYKYMTLYLNYAANVPDGVAAYAVSGAENGELALAPVGDVIPENTPVIVEGNANAYSFTYAAPVGAYAGTNLLKGTWFDSYVTPTTGYDAYVMALDKENDRIVMGKAQLNANGGTTQFQNRANKAYLELPTVQDAPAMFSFGRGEGTTGIETAVNGEQTAVIYDLAGRRVEKMEKGIYIVNGKKVIR